MKKNDSSMRSCSMVFFSSRRRHTILQGDWSSDVCSSDLWRSKMSKSLYFRRFSGVFYGTAVKIIMKNTIAQFFATGMLLVASLARAQVEYVDPSMGGQGFLLEPTRPTVHLPNSMVRVYPVRKDQLDDQIRSFPLTIISHRLGELFWLMPCDGTPDAGAWNHPAAYDQEKLTPYYLSTRFDDSLIQTRSEERR